MASGPGALEHLVTGLADAKMDSLPIVAITGQVPTHLIGTDAFQETPMVEVVAMITSTTTWCSTRARHHARGQGAFHLASTGRPGPVLIDVPKDIQNTILPQADFDVAGPARLRKCTDPDAEQVGRLRRDPVKPTTDHLLWRGHRRRRCTRRTARFATRTGIPVAMTLQGLGSMPSDHYLSLGMLGMHGTVYSNYAINDADLLLAFGVRFDDRVTGKLAEFAKRGRIVHVDIDASEINKNKTAHRLAVHCDLKAFLAAINPLLEPGEWREWHQRAMPGAPGDPMTYDPRDDVIPAAVRPRQFSNLARGQFLMTTGVGQHQMWAAQWTKLSRPRTWITSGGLGSMGIQSPRRDGRAGCLSRRGFVVDVDGDGSFLMNVQELATLHCENHCRSRSSC